MRDSPIFLSLFNSNNLLYIREKKEYTVDWRYHEYAPTAVNKGIILAVGPDIYCLLGVETFNKTLDEGQAGDDVGVLLRGVTRADVRGGTIICAPGSIESIRSFQVKYSRNQTIKRSACSSTLA